eukprot:s955_g11.t2
MIESAPPLLWAAIQEEQGWLRVIRNDLAALREEDVALPGLTAAEWPMWRSLILQNKAGFKYRVKKYLRKVHARENQAELYKVGLWAMYKQAMRLLSDDRPDADRWPCRACRKGFASRAGLSVHFFKCHRRMASYRACLMGTLCRACGREFWAQNWLAAHLQTSASCVATLRAAGMWTTAPPPGPGSKQWRKRKIEEYNLAPVAHVQPPMPRAVDEWSVEASEAYALCSEVSDGDRGRTREELRTVAASALASRPLYPEEETVLNADAEEQLSVGPVIMYRCARNKFNAFETLEVTRTFQSAEASGKKKFELSSLGLEPGKKKIDFTDKGWPSTRKEVMARLRSGGEVTRQLTEAGFNEEAVGNVEAALGYLSDCKQIETIARMLKALRTAVVKDRIHPSWQFATSTGRLTCSQPNLHSLVAGSKDIYGLRAAFKAQPGHKLVLADYSQLELRILAHISKCRVMSEGLHEGGDYHAQVAVEMFDHVREAVEKGDVTMDNDGARRIEAQESTDRQGLVLRCLSIPLAIMGVMDLTAGDLVPEKGEKKCCCCCCGCFGFIVFILFITSFQQVNRLHAGLLRNSLTGYFVGFWNEFLHFPTTLNTIEFADEAVEEGVQQLGKLRSRDKDGKQIWLDVSVQYRIYPEELPQIYREMTKVYEDVYISELRGPLQQVTNEFAIDQAWRDYPSVQKKMHDVCKAVLLQRHAECWGLQLWGIRLQVDSWPVPDVIPNRLRLLISRRILLSFVKLPKQAEETARATQLQTETIINQKGVADKNRIERDSVSAAQSALVTAQGEVLKIVQDEVKLNATEWMPERIMTPEQLVQYQRILMLKNKKNASPGCIFSNSEA